MNQIEQLLLALRQVHENAIHVMHTKDEEGISQGQMFLLFMIHRQGSIKTTDIAYHFGITPGAATAIADKLENLALIERVRDKKDRRVVVISLSAKGKEFVQNKKNKNLRMFEEILKDFSNEEIISIVLSLNKISDAIMNYKASQSQT